MTKPTYEELEQRVRQLENENVELRRFEKKLEEREETLKALLNAPTETAILVDLEGKILAVNEVAARRIGKSVNELIGLGMFEYLPNDMAESRKARSGEVVRSGKPVRFQDERAERIYDNNIFPVFDAENEVTALAIYARDITETKQVEEALRNEKEFTETALNSQIDTFFLFESTTGKAVRWNRAFNDVTGYSDEEIAGMVAPNSYYSPDDLKQAFIFIQETLKTGSGTMELDLICKDGRKLPFEYKVAVIKDEDGKPKYLISIGRDVTERKRAEETLRESEGKLARAKKMEAVGLLAGGVAHDLNNVLSGIVGYPELLLMDLPEDSKFRKPIETIQRAGYKATAIVQDLLTVARGVAIAKEPLSLNKVVGNYLKSPECMKLEQLHPTVSIKPHLDSDLLNIKGSSVHISKVLMNLVSNASEAIDGSGNVTISTMNLYIDRPIKGYDDVKKGEYAVLAVSDDGSGISSDDLERIFEPFYTKKVRGRSGTGLGLAVVWSAVRDHDGYINVKSDESGTTFELHFPITRDDILDKPLFLSLNDYKGNGETILVVDDLESQRVISCKMLDKLGYKTKAVSSGEEAVEYVKEHHVDLLLLDMIMNPGMNGREAYEKIIKIHHRQKAVIVSGFSDTDEVKETQRLGAGKYIKKPFTLEKIGLAVKEELEK